MNLYLNDASTQKVLEFQHNYKDMIVTKPKNIWKFQTTSNVWVMVAILSPADKTNLTKSWSWKFKSFHSSWGVIGLAVHAWMHFNSVAAD